MFNLKTIAWKLFKAAKVHVITSICIIAVSICLIVTMTTYIYNAKEQLDQNIDALYGEMDLLAGYDYGKGVYVSESLYEEVYSMPYVEKVSPISLEMTTVEEFTSVYTLGVENDDLVKSRYHFSSALTENTVVLSELLAKNLNVTEGAFISVNGQQKEVVEIVQTLVGAEPFQMAIIHNDVLKQTGASGLFLLVQTDMPNEVATMLKALDDQLRIDIVDDYDFVKMNLLSLFIFVIVLSVFILLISGLLLLSTMQLLLTKLKEQLMILRALGASKQQVGQLVQIQLTTMVVFGLFFGIVISFGMIQIGLPQFVQWLQLPKATTNFPLLIVIPIVLMVGLILYIYTKLQVRKAMNILPLQIVEQSIEKPLKLTKQKGIFISIVAIFGVLCLLVGQLDSTGNAALQVVFGSLILSFVVLYMMPYSFQWLLQITLQPIRKLLGKEAYLAFQQLIPQIRLNMKIVLSLIGLIVILVFGSSVLKSLQANERAYLEERFSTNLIVSNSAGDMSLQASLIQQFDDLPDVTVEQASSMGTSITMQEDSYSFDLFAMNIKEFGVTDQLDKKIIVTEVFANEENLKIGDKITPYIFDFTSETMVKQHVFEVAKIIKSEKDYIGAYVDWSSPFAQQHMIVREMMIESSNIVQAKESITELLTYYPTMQLLEKDVALQESTILFYQRWSMFIGVFIVLLIATTIGIIQTLLHMIYTNREQYTIQRLLGLSPNSLIKLLCMQVLSFVLYGLVVGTLVGGLLTRLIALVDKGGQVVFDMVAIGTVSLAIVLLMLLVFGIQAYMISRKKLASEILEL